MNSCIYRDVEGPPVAFVHTRENNMKALVQHLKVLSQFLLKYYNSLFAQQYL